MSLPFCLCLSPLPCTFFRFLLAQLFVTCQEMEELISGRVIYFNLGAHHIPHASDIPNTLEHTSATSIMFTPHNFFDRDVSRKAVSGVRINLDSTGKRGGNEVKYFGGRYDKAMSLSKVYLFPPFPYTFSSSLFPFLVSLSHSSSFSLTGSGVVTAVLDCADV